MDRMIVYPGAIPLDTDLLNTNRDTLVALGALIAATLGSNAIYDGLGVGPTSPATLAVMVAPGSITQLTSVDASAYGSLPADTVDPLVKMGINVASTVLTLAAPAVAGQSIQYLIEATFQESDLDPVVLPYYNAANPASPYLGPNNAGTAQATRRTESVLLAAKPGAAATTGTQTPPPVDPGWLGIAVVNIDYGQAQITAANISMLPTASNVPFKLPLLRPGFSTVQAFTASGTFVVPSGVTRVKATVIGGGGSGGTHSTLPAGGGGAGGQAVKVVSNLFPGTALAVTVGAAGVAPASPGVGGSGGSSSFASYISATGGVGGGGGTAQVNQGGGAGGAGYGGDVNFPGSYGTDAITVAQRGGDGGGPGAGRGTTGLIQGISATGWGGGGGGGGSNGTTGAQGGNGGPGLVIVEY
jgi:hypothetical protein